MLRRALLLAAIVADAPAIARVVDYTRGDAALAADAAELKIKPLAAPPARSARNVALTVAPGVDHVTQGLGVYCSAYKVENPVSAVLEHVASAWDRDGTLGGSGADLLTLNVAEARSNRRCFEVAEMNVRCVTRVTLKGDAMLASGGQVRRFPITADVERDASVGGVCGSLARGIGVVTWQAAIALLADAERQAEQTQ